MTRLLAPAFAGIAGVVLAAAAPQAAPTANQVKAGVDAWSRGDDAAAVKAWRGPAEHGDADAQFNLGQAYKLGRGVAADPAEAEKWYRKAAEQGHYQAEENYGIALFQKIGRASCRERVCQEVSISVVAGSFKKNNC